LSERLTDGLIERPTDGLKIIIASTVPAEHRPGTDQDSPNVGG